MHASPLLLKAALSPLTLLMTPSSMVTVSPQPTPQKLQTVSTSLEPFFLPFEGVSFVRVVVANTLTPLLYTDRTSILTFLIAAKSIRLSIVLYRPVYLPYFVTRNPPRFASARSPRTR